MGGVATALSMLIAKTTSPFRQLSINSNNSWNSQAIPPTIGPSSGSYTLAIPEPGSALLASLGTLGLALYGYRRR